MSDNGKRDPALTGGTLVCSVPVGQRAGMGTLAGEVQRKVPASEPKPPAASRFGSLVLTQDRPKAGALDLSGHPLLPSSQAPDVKQLDASPSPDA